MSEMVERVAKALYAKLHADRTPWMAPAFEDISLDAKISYRETAKAAIAAMREPTEAMQNAGMNATGLCHGEIETIFKAMIDAALA